MNGMERLQEGIHDILKDKADHADLFFQNGMAHNVLFEQGKTEEITSSQHEGVGARVVIEDYSSYAYSPSTDAATAFQMLVKSAYQAGIFLKGKQTPPQNKEPLVSKSSALPPLDTSFLHDLDQKIRAESNSVRQVSFRLRTSDSSILVLSPKGLFHDRRQYTSFSVQVVVERKGMLQTGYEVRASKILPESFFKANVPFEIAHRALERALLMLEALPCPAGLMPVILGGEAGGTMVHEACGHGLEADIIQKDYSVYRGRLGEKVASPSVTLIDDATLPGLYGSYAFDDEGTPAQKTVLINEGLLCGYLTDILSSRRGNLPLTGNGRRESYQHLPLPRMTNTYIAPGPFSKEEILSMVPRGLYVKRMGGGEVDPTSGNFVFQVTEGYLVENGKLGRPIKGGVLTGNGPKALAEIEAVGNDLHFEPGICGKEGQGVPVTDGQPTLLVRELLVGGSEAANAS